MYLPRGALTSSIAEDYTADIKWNVTFTIAAIPNAAIAAKTKPQNLERMLSAQRRSISAVSLSPHRVVQRVGSRALGQFFVRPFREGLEYLQHRRGPPHVLQH
jgi:hypothetical protein